MSLESPIRSSLNYDAASTDGREPESGELSPTMGSRLFNQPKTDMLFKVIIVGDSGKPAMIKSFELNSD